MFRAVSNAIVIGSHPQLRDSDYIGQPVETRLC